MKNFVNTLYEFCQNIQFKAEGIEIADKQIDKLQIFVKEGEQSSFMRFVNKRRKKLSELYGLDTTPDHIPMFFTSGAHFEWVRGEQKPNEGLLKGGFSINGITDIFKDVVPFWESPLNRFENVGDQRKPSADSFSGLRWFDSPSFFNDSRYTPQYGCIVLEDSKWPSSFVFFDSGLQFEMATFSFEQYFGQLIASAAVVCWQYFFVDPDQIISKNKGLHYRTWERHKITLVDKELRKLNLNKDTHHDRLDLIMEYLERCIRLLPSSFPFIDFSYHIDFYERLNQKYLAQK
ncbi:MAG: hypothetical protein AB8H47_02375 [Bacteroidia bacterium]